MNNGPRLIGRAEPGDEERGYQIIDGFYGPYWRWCFCNGWERVDNTAWGAAKRILWLLLYGLPADFLEQQSERSPLAYKDWKPTIQDWLKAEENLPIGVRNEDGSESAESVQIGSVSLRSP